MKVIFRNIMSTVLAVIVLVTTSGFTVFEHHCNTAMTTDYAFLLPVFDCDHDQHNHHDALPVCCSENGSSKAEKCTDDDCCDTNTHLVMLDITLDTQVLSKKMTPGVILVANSSEIIREPNSSEISHIIISNDLPPPLSGKDLHIFLRQLNIPYPSV
jgi:hypothetical protein